eukprot:gene26000-11691_t
MDRLTSMTKRHGVASQAKVALAGLLLPLAFGIDVMVVPGPQMFTYYTVFQMWKHSKSTKGSARLTKYVGQEGKDKNVRVNYAGDSRLDKRLKTGKVLISPL